MADSPPIATPLTHRQILVAFSGLVLVMLLAALDSTIVSTALPTIVSELGGLEHLAWVVTAYLLAQTIVTPVYGKLGDLYGRKAVLAVATVIFLAGSVLCGLSANMTQLIVFRAVQGLGGGGLNVTAQAVVGDIVPARDRGRYQGIFGAVYGLASIGGPLLGGFFTTQLSWRWIFYVNVPLGIAALVVLGATLPGVTRRVSHAIDYAGAAALALTLSGVTLVADLGGALLPWASPAMAGLIALSVLGLVALILVERKASEPVLPLHLFRGRTFVIGSVVGLIVGFSLFGSVTYFPLYLQVVKDVSPTASGLQMMPMMLGMLVTSVLSGQLISRSGRYRIFPIIGTGVMASGLFMLSRLSPGSTPAQASALMLVLGIGLGMVMQVLILAVQNDVEYRDLGVATSGATLFRLIGGSVGTAILGAIFSSRLSANLARALPGAEAAVGAANPRALSAAGRAAYNTAFAQALGTVFLVATVVCVAGFLLAWLLPEHPLRTTVAAAARDVGSESGGAFAQAVDSDSVESQLYGALTNLADRDVRREHIQRVVTRAGETLSPLAAWLLVQIDRSPERDAIAVAAERGVEVERAGDGIRELLERGLITIAPEAGQTLTHAGCAVLERLIEARRSWLSELAMEWKSDEQEDVRAFLRRAVRDVVPDARTA